MLTPQQPARGWLPSPDVLDTADATSRVLGNGALYLRMLRRFSDDHPAGATPIRAALACADLGLAHRLAHTLKGTAGMIGARRLHGSASVLEHDLRTGGAHAAAAALEQVEEALREVMVEVERVLAGAPADGGPAVHPALAGSGDAVLEQLAVLLDLGDGAAIDVLEASAPTLKALLGVAVFSELMLAAHAFEFEAALATLQRAVPARDS
jgi:HPt (histidine-containing phosphotransfer) domain-containing protein